MDQDARAAMIDKALINSDRRHGGRRQTLGDLHDDVLASGIDVGETELGRRAAILAHEKRIAVPLATWGEMLTGLWRKVS